MAASFRNCIAGALLALPLIAVADEGIPRYVSGAGVDSGDCANKFRPCRTLSYAFSKAGKGDKISVAEGDYEVRSAQDLSALLAVQNQLSAGFDRHTGFSDRNASGQTVLVGVPPELRERFEQAGFTVIVDSKSLFESSDERAARQAKTVVASKVTASELAHKSAPCAGNSSNGFACQNISLSAHLPFSQLLPTSARGNDVWGFVDLNTGREYAFMGMNNGVAVVDVTNPASPEQVALATGSTTTWRDINIYQRYDTAAKRWRAYAYVTADQVQDSLMVLDLSGLPNGVERVNYTSDFRPAHTGYVANVDYTFGIAERDSTPLLTISGSNLGTPRGSYRLYSLGQPRSPQFASETTSGYAHDVASFVVRDSRKDTQCFNASAAPACHVVSDFNENSLDLWDITNPSAPRMLVSHPYSNASYTHSGWWTENGRYVFVHDELDEQRVGLNTTIRAFDVSNLRAPVLAGTWTGPTRSIDHNGYVRGNRYYFSNYSEGLTVLDITNPAAMQRVGYFDTYPSSSEMAFVGAWSTYPFFPSGTIAIGDINTGLYLVKNEALQSANGTLAFTSRVATGNEGQQINLTVSRSGGATGAISVDVDLLLATASANDAALATTTLTWAANDTAPKTATLNLASDTEAEDMELLFVRLKNSQGGATINYPDTAYIYVTEPTATTKLRLVESTLTVDESRAKALVTVARTGSLTGSAQVSYRTLVSNTYSGFNPAQGELTWAAGDADAKIIQVDLNTAALNAGQTGSFQVELHSPVSSALETSTGTAASTLAATIDVLGEGGSQPPPAPGGGVSNNRGGGGGGSMGFVWIAMLMGVGITVRRSRHSNVR